MTETNAPAYRFRPYPAPWRSGPEGPPDAQTLFLEQSREEELFQRIMGEATQEKTPLEDLLRHTMRLAFPHALDSDLERAIGVIKARTDHWQDSFDREGNPCWISLTLSERDENTDKIQPDAVLPSDAESAAPPKTDTEGRSEKDRERPGFFGGLLGMFFRPPDPRRTQITPASIAAGRGTIPPPQPRPLRSLIRLVILGGICALAYYALVIKGCTPKVM